MKATYPIINLSFILLFLIGCSNGRSFYYTDIKANETKVYKFVNEDDSKHIIYWKIKLSENKDILYSDTYNSNFHLDNEFQEKITKYDSQLIKYTNYYEEVDYPVIAEIIDNSVYAWDTKYPTSYKVKFKVDGDVIVLEKIRTFIGFTDKTYQNKKIKVKQFEDKYRVKVNGRKIDDTFNISYYAKGVGIIQFDMHSKDKISKMKLREILTEAQFEEMKEKNGKNSIGLENKNLEQKIIYKEFIGYIFFFASVDSARHHTIGIGLDGYGLDNPHPDSLGMSAVGYRLDKQNPETAGFIQLIKDAEKDNVIEPLKVILKESESGGRHIVKILKISEAEEKKWKESGKWSTPTLISN